MRAGSTRCSIARRGPSSGLYHSVRPALVDAHLQKMAPVTIPARDGLTMVGYLTLPEGGSTNLPMVMVIHGGPYSRDIWGFNTAHAASSPIAALRRCLSVNYRGSTGFGKGFITAADHEWGGKMHDDLIDALDWAVAKGIADPKRVGFFGGSVRWILAGA